MALIHEKLYRSTDFASIDFREYAESLIAHLSRSYVTHPGIRFKVDVARVLLDIDTAVPCGLIINELLTNSLKYAFPGGAGGEIRVSMTCEADHYTPVVGDNGVGLPPGTDFRNTPSLGLQFVVTMAGQCCVA